jgi:hypothetical protein
VFNRASPVRGWYRGTEVVGLAAVKNSCLRERQFFTGRFRKGRHIGGTTGGRGTGAPQLLKETPGSNDDDCVFKNAVSRWAIERKREGVNAGVKEGSVRWGHDKAKPKKG